MTRVSQEEDREKIDDPNCDLISLLVSLGADLTAEDDSGRTPLMAAVERDDHESIKALVKEGSDVNYRASRGTALHHAATVSKPHTIKLLLDLGADVNSKDLCRNTPLHNATLIGKLEAVKLFVVNGASPEAENSFGMTPLDSAACSGSIEVFEFFVEKGINLYPSESKGVKLLSIAVKCKHDPLALWLLNSEADGNISFKKQTFYRLIPACVSCISLWFCACIPISFY